jgi:hypothetical protein
VRLRYFEALFIRIIYDGFITCCSLSETVGIRVPVRNVETPEPFIIRFHVTDILLLAAPLAANEMCNVNLFDSILSLTRYTELHTWPKADSDSK